MTNEEQNALRTMIREVVREEVNAAVYASEQRLGERLDLIGIAQREIQNELVLLRADFTEAVAVLDQATIQINDLQASQRALEVKLDESVAAIRRDQSALEVKLDESVAAIRRDQSALEKKLEENVAAIRQEMQKLATELRQEMQKQTSTMTNFARQFVDINGRTNARIDLHERTPVDQAHPHSAA